MSRRDEQKEDDYEDDENFPDTLSDWEADENEDPVTIIDLFSNEVYHSLEQYLSDCLQKYTIDLISLIRCIGGDEIACIMMVNFIRTLVRDSQETITKDEIIRLVVTKEFLSNEQFMHPVIPDDQLLFLLGEYINEFDPREEEKAGQNDDKEWTEANNYSFLNNVVGVPEPTLPITKEEMLNDDNDSSLIGDYYFDGYSHIGIHETMLRDAARTQAYANALMSNASLLEGKVVLDVGCGTGILSMLAARAGAKKVIGVDMSSILRISQKVIEKNGFADRIRLVRGRIEDIVLPLEEGEEIDVIVSEWMGYGLYFENMLPAVMYARDKYLRRGPDGLFSCWSIMPSHSSLFVEAISVQDSAAEDRLLWWKDVYGFDMTDMVDLFFPEAQVDSVSHQLVVSNRSIFHELSILTAGDADLDFVRPFQLVLTKDALVSAFVISFDVLFSPASDSTAPVILSTGTAAETTHWKQTVLWLAPSRRVTGSAGDTITGTIRYTRSEKNDRDYEISVAWAVVGGTSGFASQSQSQTFVLGG